MLQVMAENYFGWNLGVGPNSAASICFPTPAKLRGSGKSPPWPNSARPPRDPWAVSGFSTPTELRGSDFLAWGKGREDLGHVQESPDPGKIAGVWPKSAMAQFCPTPRVPHLRDSLWGIPTGITHGGSPWGFPMGIPPWGSPMGISRGNSPSGLPMGIARGDSPY